MMSAENLHKFRNELTAVLFHACIWLAISFVWFSIIKNPATVPFCAAVCAAASYAAYRFSHKIVLSSVRARRISEREEPQLYAIVRELAAESSLSMPRVYVVPALAPNIFVTGRSPSHACLCCTEGLLMMMNHRELRAVVGHELRHVANRDIVPASIACACARIILDAACCCMKFGQRKSDSRKTPVYYLGKVLFILTAPLAACIIRTVASQERELVADKESCELTSDPEALASALHKIESVTRIDPMDKTAGVRAVQMLMIASPFAVEGADRLLSAHMPVSERTTHLLGKDLYAASSDSAGFSGEYVGGYVGDAAA